MTSEIELPTSCRRRLMEAGLPYPKSNCMKCGHILNGYQRCADEAAAEATRAASYELFYMEWFRGEVARCEQEMADAQARLAEAERLQAAGVPSSACRGRTKASRWRPRRLRQAT